MMAANFVGNADDSSSSSSSESSTFYTKSRRRSLVFESTEMPIGANETRHLLPSNQTRQGSGMQPTLKTVAIITHHLFTSTPKQKHRNPDPSIRNNNNNNSRLRILLQLLLDFVVLATTTQATGTMVPVIRLIIIIMLQ